MGSVATTEWSGVADGERPGDAQRPASPREAGRREPNAVVRQSGEASLEVIDRVVQCLRQAVTEASEVLANQRDLRLPVGVVDLEQFVKVGVGHVETIEVQRILGWDEADRGVGRITSASNPLEDPLEHAAVLAIARPEPLAIGVFPEPVDLEDLRELVGIAGGANLEPVTEVVRHVVPAEGEHRHRVVPKHANLAGGGGGGLRG